MQVAELEEREAGNAAQAAQNANAAQAAQNAGNWPDAAQKWRHARQAFPQFAHAWASEASVLLADERLDEAEQVITQAVATLPDSIEVASLACAVAAMRGAWPAARQRWLRLEADFAGHPYLAAQGPGLGAMIEAGLQGLDTGTLAAQAVAAEAKGDWPQAVDLRLTLAAREPAILAHAVAAVRPLKELQRFDEADRLMEHAIAAHPASLEARAYHAEIATTRGNRAQAAARWNQVFEECPDALNLAPLAVPALREAGEFAAANRLIERAIAQEPDRLELRIHQALVNERAGDWDKAVPSWHEAVRLAPGDHGIMGQRGGAMWQAGLNHLLAGTWDEASSLVPNLSGAALEAAHLLLGFIAFGNGCEFAVIQRLLGAEPLDLLRFIGVMPNDLARMIEHGFPAIDDPAVMELTVGKHDEYFVDARSNARGGALFSHGFAHVGMVEPEAFFRRQLVRLRKLADKLYRDLALGTKICLHHAPKQRISDDEAHNLLRAIRARGNGRLAVTRAPENGHAPGTVSFIGPDILVGYFEMDYGVARYDIEVDKWHQLARAIAAAPGFAVPAF